MIEQIVLFPCLIASYFAIVWLLSGDPAQAMGNGVLAAIVFSIAFLLAGLVSRGQPWRAFWIANTVLIVVIGVVEFLGLRHSTSTRFGGAYLSAGGYPTVAGLASLAFDLGVFSLCNFIGFYLSRAFIRRFNL